MRKARGKKGVEEVVREVQERKVWGINREEEKGTWKR